MHSDDFRVKHYSLCNDQRTMLIPWAARLLHTYHNVHLNGDTFSAAVLEPWGVTFHADDFKSIILGEPANIVACKRLRHSALTDLAWSRSHHKLLSGSNTLTMSPAAVIVDVIGCHLVIEEPECDLPRIEREFLLVGHGAYLSEKEFARLDYVGCWAGNNGAKVLLEIFEVRPGA